ncbi:MAG: exodeoxyribonuclease III [Alphaproteobacteria bacterium]
MTIATWNVNSIKVRAQTVADWLDSAKTDILCLQELKVTDDKFPAELFEERGYHAAVHGQTTYNGVAILSRLPLEDVSTGLPGDDSDEQARYLEATVSTETGALRVASLYLPNGNPVPGPKYDYKLGWMARLEARARDLLAFEEPFVLAGDYNIIPSPDDVHDPAAWADDALFRPESRQAFNRIVWLGLTDAYRACHGEAHRYTFWDYQGGAWPKDHGIRIDHLLLSPQAADRLVTADIDKTPRGHDQPSDHVPVWCRLDL